MLAIFAQRLTDHLISLGEIYTPVPKTLSCIRESPPQFENRIMARLYVRNIIHTKKLQFVS